MRSKRSRKAVSYVYEANDENTDEEDIVPYNPKRSKKTDTRVVKLHALKKIVRDEEDQSSVPDSETYQDSVPAIHDPHYDPTKKGLMSLPPEIRLNIYKRVLIKERCVDFGRRRNFARSSSLLSANKTIATEGAEVLYSMNKFVLRPCRDKQGKYYEEEWNWLGYKAVRDFIESIGPTNLGFLKTIGLAFHDAAPTDEPKTSTESRRFQYNADLIRSLELLGQHATGLEYVKLYFTGRAKFRHRDSKATKKFSQILCSLQADIVTIGEITSKSFSTWNMWPLDVTFSTESRHWITSGWDNKINKDEQEYVIKNIRRFDPLNPKFRAEIDSKIAEAKSEQRKDMYPSWYSICS